VRAWHSFKGELRSHGLMKVKIDPS
jgi:hypothetical protein